ncbi:hypothetical protein L1887_03809 [Cichorium endivia]|nr:hypothetical protein L1887_03809 [Cichorium endivia]
MKPKLWYNEPLNRSDHRPRCTDPRSQVFRGGQDASAASTTDHGARKFEAKFYDKVLQEEIGGVKGHFGPTNALAFNPDRKRLNQISNE